MAEQLLVLREPLVDLLPVDGDVAGEELRGLERLAVRPDGVRRRAVADADRPVRRLALVRAVRLPFGGLEQVEAHVVVREVVDREMPGLVEQLRVAAVDDRLLREHGANPLRNRIEEEHGSSWRLDVEVEAALRLLRERPGSDRERHHRN